MARWSALPTAFTPQETPLVLISVTGWAGSTAIVRPEKVIEKTQCPPPPPATKRTNDSPAFVAQRRNELCPLCQIPMVGHKTFLKIVFF